MENGGFTNFWFAGSRNSFVIHESRTLNSNYNLYLVKILQLLFLDKN